MTTLLCASNVAMLESVYKSRSVRSGQNSEARTVVLSGQLPIHLGQQAVAVHQAGEEEEQLRLGQGLTQTHLQQVWCSDTSLES